MVLKRKRSESEVSSASSLLSSPLSNSNFMSIDNAQSSSPARSLFSSRTRKRHRDNRPSESTVHEHTMSLLYSAQQNPQSQTQTQASSTHASRPTQDPIPSIHSHESSHQSSLHSFWSLPSQTRDSSPSSMASSNAPSMTLQSSLLQPSNCEDCNVLLVVEDRGDSMDLDIMMDLDTNNSGNFGCTSCGKQVCHGCAVSNLGADRKCLTCAKPPPKRFGSCYGWLYK